MAVVRRPARARRGGPLRLHRSRRADQGRAGRPRPPRPARRVRLVVRAGTRRRRDRGRGRPGAGSVVVRGTSWPTLARPCCSRSRSSPSWPSTSTPTGWPRWPGAASPISAQVQIDPWPAGNFGLAHEDGRRITRCICLLPRAPDRQRLRPSHRGARRLRRHGPGRGARGRRLRRRASCRPTPGSLPRPGRRREPAHRPRAPRDHPARGGQLHHRRQPRDLAALVAAGGDGPLRGPGAAHASATRTAGGCGRSCTGPSVSEMVVPYGHPGPMHGWKNAFDAGEWGLGRMANSLTLGCDCLGRDPLPRRRVRHRDGRALRGGQRHLHARGGLRHPLEARRPARRHHRGAPLPAAGRSAPSPRSATTSTASTGTSTSTARSSSR